MTRPARLRYPTKAQIERTIAAARACGIDVAGFEITSDGAIRIIEPRAAPSIPMNDFERYMDKL